MLFDIKRLIVTGINGFCWAYIIHRTSARGVEVLEIIQLQGQLLCGVKKLQYEILMIIQIGRTSYGTTNKSK